jgi:electron transfer flavoprotein beta subunit
MGSYDIILCGKQAIDGDTGQVGPGIACQLQINQLTNVFSIQEINFDAGTLRVERLLEEGREIVDSRLPALLTVLKGINEPRYPSFAGIRRATRMDIPTWTAAEIAEADPAFLGLEGSPTRVVRVFSPPARAGECCIMGTDSPSEAARQLVDRLLAEKIL